MNKQDIKQLALDNGFKLKQQPDGSMDLNPYVYQFSKALIDLQGCQPKDTLIVMRQKRHKISNEHCADYGEWQAWEECSIEDYNDVKSLIDAGYNYEVRELMMAPSEGE
jgi:hypothetical protein